MILNVEEVESAANGVHQPDEKPELKEGEMYFSDFEKAYTAMLEIQKGAYRKIDGVIIRSLPIDLEFELADTISKAETIYKPFVEARRKVCLSYGMAETGAGYLSAELLPHEKQVEVRVEMKKMEDRPVKIDFLPIKDFSRKQIKESKIEFDSCPNKQFFFKYCLSPDAS